MKNSEKKKISLMIATVITILLIVFAVWFFFIKDSGISNNISGGDGNSQEESNTDDETANNSSVEYDYRNGVLTTIVDENNKPKQTDFIINGIILVGNQHIYEDLPDTETAIAYFAEQGYKTEEINSSFYLNEWIEIYLDTDYAGSANDVKILIVPHKTVTEYEKMPFYELLELAEDKGTTIDYQEPNEEYYKYVGDGYINEEYPEGKYDLLFTYKGKLAYILSMSLTRNAIIDDTEEYYE